MVGKYIITLLSPTMFHKKGYNFLDYTIHTTKEREKLLFCLGPSLNALVNLLLPLTSYSIYSLCICYDSF